MLSTSEQFQSTSIATVRWPCAKVEITWTDPYLDLSIRATPNEQNYTSWNKQVADLIDVVPYKYLHIDEESTWFDGNYHFAPATEEEALNYQMGWWGASVAGVGGALVAPYPTMAVEHSKRPVFAVVVVGDSAYNEYPVDFDIFVYTESGLVATHVVTGNDQLRYEADLHNLNILEANRVDIVIKKWSKSGTVVKISEFYTAIVRTYEDDDILSLKLLEELEYKDGTIPIGNVSANELDLSLENVIDRFFSGNTDSILHTLIRSNRKIKAWLGFKYSNGSKEMLPLGVFWSGDWDTPEHGSGASTSSKDRMGLLNKFIYYKSQVWINITVYDLAVNLLEAARLEMPDMKYNVDSRLTSYVIPTAHFPRQSYQKCLKDLMGACLGFAYCDRNGVLQLKANPLIEAATHDLEITKDNYFTKNQPSKTDEISNYIEITIQPLIINTEDKIYAGKKSTIAPYATIEIEAKYSSAPCVNASASLVEEDTSTGVVIQKAEYYSWGAILTINNSAIESGAYKVEIVGQKYSVQGEQVVVVSDTESIRENGTLKFELKDKYLIQTEDLAKNIGSILVQSYKLQKKDVDIDWRGNPALELADTIRIPEYQKGNINTVGNFVVTKNQLQYDGSIRCVTSARKVSQIETEYIATKYQDVDDDSEIWQDIDESTIIVQDRG